MQVAAFTAGTLLFSETAGAVFQYKDEGTVKAVFNTLKDALRGEVVRSKIRLQGVSSDFGGVLKKQPRIIVVPADEQDVMKTLEIARDLQVPVSFRGAGHSCFGQSLSDGGILLLNSSEEEREISIKGGLVEVPSRALWSSLEKQLNKKGLTSPVLTDYLDLTVGGTLSVGGYGLRSFQLGGQVDNVASLTLILPDGTKKICSEKENPDLFHYSLCGLGQLGLISSVRFKAIPYKEKTVVFYLYCPSVDTFIKTLKELFIEKTIDDIDHFSAYWIYGSFVIEIGKSFAIDEKVECRKLRKNLARMFPTVREKEVSHYHRYIHRARENWVGRYPYSYRLWEDYAFDLAALEEFLRRNIAGPDFQNSKALPAVYFLAMDSGKSKEIPFSLTTGRSGEMIFGAGYYYMVPIGQKKELQATKDQLQRNMADCIELGGRPYLYGWHDLSENQKQLLYREEFQELQKMKRKYDPDNIVNPHVFVL